MNYSFPFISHISDVLPHIEGSPEFVVVAKDGYTVINYVVMNETTFPPVDDIKTAIRRECRGLVFDTEGKLINRRYHKFFNVNERDETSLTNINLNKPHMILEKLDGSMVSPCYVNGHIRWMTKMGITDTSMEAEAFVASRPDYTELAERYLKNGFTPVFEWCSNKNRIVLNYPEDRLVLTAMRVNHSGNYLLQDALENIGERYGIEVVKAIKTKSLDINVIIDLVRNHEGEEGVVVRFDDGHMFKIKSDWYVRIHKVKALLGQERDVVSLILNNELDDLLPVLPKDDVNKIEKFRNEMLLELTEKAETLLTAWTLAKSAGTKKDYAINSGGSVDPMWRGMVFRLWEKDLDWSDAYQLIVDSVKKNCGSKRSYQKVKDAFLSDVHYNEIGED
jgi:RNA ligase